MALLDDKKFVLGSSSPRRKELFSLICKNFDIITPDCSEDIDPSLSVEDAIIDISKRKALCIKSDNIVITADTAVLLSGIILGKPKDYNDAFTMLKSLSANTHTVITAVSIKKDGVITSFASSTDVTFYPLSNSDIEYYLSTDEPFDKAGAYGIQGFGGTFVKSISGDYFNVVGLPVAKLKQILTDKGALN